MGASKETQKRFLDQMKVVFNYAVEIGEISLNPARNQRIKIKKHPLVCLTPEEIKTFLYQARRQDHQLYVPWSLALLAGLRIGEIMALRRGDVSLDARTISVHANWSKDDGYHSTKSNRSRNVPINDQLNDILMISKNHKAVMMVNGEETEFYDLVCPFTTDLKNGRAAQLTAEFCKSIGVKEMTFHDLRASFLTILASKGVSALTIQRIAGHSNYATTEIYIRESGVDTTGAPDVLEF